jgi:hypothetical protein
MPIWVLCYLALFLLFSGAGAADSLNDRRSRLLVALEILGSIVAVLLVVANWSSHLPWLRGPVALAALALVLAAETFTRWADVQRTPAADRRFISFATVVVAASLLPVVWAGLRLSGVAR